MPASFLVADRIKVTSSSLLGLNDDLSLRTGRPEEEGRPSASRPLGERDLLVRSARPVRKAGQAGRLKRQITIRLGGEVIDYFKRLAGELGIPYQNLINLYLMDCVVSERRPEIEWVGSKGPGK
jgi:uncharacterized protein (DUF4415 family)